MQVWIVMQNKGWVTGSEHHWELGGVFSTREKALEVCTEYGDTLHPVELWQKVED